MLRIFNICLSFLLLSTYPLIASQSINDLNGSLITVTWVNGMTNAEPIPFAGADLLHGILSDNSDRAFFKIFDLGTGTTGLDLSLVDDPVNAVIQFQNAGNNHFTPTNIRSINFDLTYAAVNSIFVPPSYPTNMIVLPGIPGATSNFVDFSLVGLPTYLSVTPKSMTLTWDGEGLTPGSYYNWQIDTMAVAVPEPATYLLLGSLLFLGLTLKRRQHLELSSKS